MRQNPILIIKDPIVNSLRWKQPARQRGPQPGLPVKRLGAFCLGLDDGSLHESYYLGVIRPGFLNQVPTLGLGVSGVDLFI